MKTLFRAARSHFGPNHAGACPTIKNLALLQAHLGLYEKALPLYRRSPKIVTQFGDRNSHETATVQNHLATL